MNEMKEKEERKEEEEEKKLVGVLSRTNIPNATAH
jgi:hypothetical protein